MATTFNVTNKTGLTSSEGYTWVAGWINGGDSIKVLGSDGTFSAPTKEEVSFVKIDSSFTFTLSETTNGNDRLVFVVCPDQPAALTISNGNPIQYTAYPYANPPGVAAPGPYDIFEFGTNAQDDLSAVNGFGLNLSFSVDVDNTNYQYGVGSDVATRAQIGDAFTKFVANDAVNHPSSADFSELLYNSPISSGAPTPPSIANQYFAICDPNDMLASKTENYTKASGDALESYWDSTLVNFFTNNYWLSINLSSDPTNPNIYSGQCTQQTNPQTGISCPAYTLSNGTNTYTFYMPLGADSPTQAGLAGAQYVFQQAFNELTPAGSAGDAGLLQDCIWEAICRGVSTYGVFPQKKSNGESTTSWNDASTWYQDGIASHVYAKFLHYSTADGKDSRQGGTPIMYGNAVYGFSMDENPIGPYSGPNVPSKTPVNVPDGSTVNIVVGPWK